MTYIESMSLVSQAIASQVEHKAITDRATEIQTFIAEVQRGRSGIYPHHVAATVAARFNMTLPDALAAVMVHIRRVIAA